MSEGIEPATLMLAAAEVFAGTRGRYTVLRINDAGHLAIIADGAYVGLIDLGTAVVKWVDGYVTPWAAP